jgi:hypothetical protein
MSAIVILSPAAAADAVAHEEQLCIWADDHIIGALALGGYLRDDLSYDDKVNLALDMQREIKSIIEAAFDHLEARTIKRLP